MIYDREAPPEVLKQLREVDPRVKLLYMGEGSWQLGVVHEDVSVRQAATGRLARLWPHRDSLDAHRRIEILREQREGFVGLHIVPEEEMWNGKLVADFRRADWQARHELTEVMAERAEATDMNTGLQRRIAVLRDFITSEGKSIHRRTLRRSKGFLQPGLN